MWRTFYIEYTDVSQFDEFLTRIEQDGYTPIFLRESWINVFDNGYRKIVVEALVTSRKKDA